MPLQGLLRGSNVSKTSKVRSITRMNLNTLNEFRHGMYDCFGNAKDALFNLVDALSSEAGASSFPELSFSPFFERTWASLYEALEDGQIDADRLRQLRAVVALLLARGLHPIILGDRWYACAPFLTRLADVEAASLLRVKRNRVFYRRAPERFPGQVGASRKDGERFQCQDESSHGEPDETWEGLDAKGARIQVRCWNHLHLRTERSLEVSVIQIIRHGASGKARDPKISWFVWKGARPAPLAEISPTYRLRYSHEHGYRFDKQELLWDEP